MYERKCATGGLPASVLNLRLTHWRASRQWHTGGTCMFLTLPTHFFIDNPVHAPSPAWSIASTIGERLLVELGIPIMHLLLGKTFHKPLPAGPAHLLTQLRIAAERDHVSR